jgi:uncharacterized membrane protein
VSRASRTTALTSPLRTFAAGNYRSVASRASPSGALNPVRDTMIPIASKILITRKPASSRSHSIVKTLTWRVFAELDTFVVSYLITGRMTWSLSIVGVETTTKTVLYYLHERAWGHIAWGGRSAGKLTEGASVP